MTTDSFDTDCDLGLVDDWAARIRDAREQAGLSQQTLAREAGVTKATVAQWETGTSRNLRLAHLRRLAQALGRELESFIDADTAAQLAGDVRPPTRTGERLREAMAKANVSNSELARHLDISFQAVQNAKRTGRMSSLNLLYSARRLGCSLEWLLTGEEVADGYGGCGPTTTTVPLIAWRDLPVTDRESLRASALDWVATSRHVSPLAYALTVRNRIMAPPFTPGARIIVDPDRTPEDGAYVIAVFSDADEPTLKRLVRDSPHDYLEAVDPRYPVTELSTPVQFVGVVVQTYLDL